MICQSATSGRDINREYPPKPRDSTRRKTAARWRFLAATAVWSCLLVPPVVRSSHEQQPPAAAPLRDVILAVHDPSPVPRDPRPISDSYDEYDYAADASVESGAGHKARNDSKSEETPFYFPEEQTVLLEEHAGADGREGRQLFSNTTWRTLLSKIDWWGFVIGAQAAQVNVVEVSGNGVGGTIYLNQDNGLANMFITGNVTGLPANQVINIHQRRRGDVSSDCANIGEFMNPHNTSQAGGFVVTEATADTSGTVTLSNNSTANDASLFGPWGLIGRTVAIASGSKSAGGTVLGCGLVEYLV